MLVLRGIKDLIKYVYLHFKTTAITAGSPKERMYVSLFSSQTTAITAGPPKERMYVSLLSSQTAAIIVGYPAERNSAGLE